MVAAAIEMLNMGNKTHPKQAEIGKFLSSSYFKIDFNKFFSLNELNADARNYFLRKYFFHIFVEIILLNFTIDKVENTKEWLLFLIQKKISVLTTVITLKTQMKLKKI